MDTMSYMDLGLINRTASALISMNFVCSELFFVEG